MVCPDRSYQHVSFAEIFPCAALYQAETGKEVLHRQQNIFSAGTSAAIEKRLCGLILIHTAVFFIFHTAVSGHHAGMRAVRIKKSMKTKAKIWNLR